MASRTTITHRSRSQVQVIWYIVRCVKGLQALAREEPVADVETWLF